MTRDPECPECEAKDLLYREVHRETPLQIRVLYIVGASTCIGIGIINAALGTGGFFPLVVILFGILAWWAFLSGRMTDPLTSVRFKCSECSHEWDVEIQGKSYARKWQELPQTEWRKVVPGREVPGLGR